jgi:DNA primase
MNWKEVPRCDPSRFTVKTMRKRIAKVGDPDRRDVAPQGKPAPALRPARHPAA